MNILETKQESYYVCFTYNERNLWLIFKTFEGFVLKNDRPVHHILDKKD